MILHIEAEQLLIYEPRDDLYWAREESTFIKYAQAARVHLKSIIIRAPEDLRKVPKLTREFILSQNFKRFEGPASSYWRLDFKNGGL